MNGRKGFKSIGEFKNSLYSETWPSEEPILRKVITYLITDNRDFSVHLRGKYHIFYEASIIKRFGTLEMCGSFKATKILLVCMSALFLTPSELGARCILSSRSLIYC